MKRYTVLIILFQFLFNSVIGSELPDSSFVWTIRSIDWEQCVDVNSYMLSGDTLIGNKHYKKILVTPDSVYSESNNSYFCAARDSAGFWFFIPSWDSTEYLLYNFNASVGEILEINNPWSVGRAEAHVVSKDSILVNDEYRTRLGIGAQQGEVWEYWIEDVGCSFGLFFSCHFIFDWVQELSCTYLRGEFYYNFGSHDFCGCWPGTLVENQINNQQVSIFPNPSTGTFIIRNQSKEPSIVSFYSIEGKLLDKILLESNSSKQISIEYSGSVIARIVGSGLEIYRIIQIVE